MFSLIVSLVLMSAGGPIGVDVYIMNFFSQQACEEFGTAHQYGLTSVNAEIVQKIVTCIPQSEKSL